MSDVHELMQHGDFSGALRELRSTAEGARDYRSYYSEGKIHLALGDYQAARARFDQASERRGAAFVGIGAEERAIAWFLEGDAAEAIATMEQNVADLASGRVTYSSDTFGLGPRLLLVAFLVLSGRRDEARRLIATLLEVCEGSSFWPVPIARFLQGAISEAEFLDTGMTGSDGVRMSGLAANRRQSRIEFYIGVMRELSGHSQGAAEMFRRAAARNVPVDPEWFFAHGLARAS